MRFHPFAVVHGHAVAPLVELIAVDYLGSGVLVLTHTVCMVLQVGIILLYEYCTYIHVKYDTVALYI